MPDTEMTDAVFDGEEQDAINDASVQVTKVLQWFEEAKKYRRTREQQWRINEDLLRNKIDMSGARTQTDMRFNIPLAVVESIKPIINDFLPTFDVMPEGQNDVYFADMVQKRKKQIANIGNFHSNIMESISDSLEYSDGLFELRPILADEVGEDDEILSQTLKGIEFNAIDPFTWYPAPHAVGMRLGKDSRFHIFAVPMHKDEIQRQYGIKVQGEGRLDDQRAWIKSNDEDESSGDYSLVLTCYSADVDEEKYPDGRVTIVVEEQLVSDEPMELYRIPIFQFSNYKSEHDTFGYSEPELVASQTKAINEGMSSMFDGLREAGNPKRKIVKSLFNRVTKNFNRLKNIEVNRPDDVSYLQPSAPSASMFSAIELTLRLIDVVTGQNDVSAGRNQTSNVTSGKAIMALQEASQARVRYKISKEIVPIMEDIGEFIVWIIQNFDQEIISIREESRSGELQFTEFNPQMTKEDAQMMAQEDPTFDPRTFNTLQDTNLNIRVTAGFSQPSGRLSRKEEADINFDAGRIGIEQWCTDTDQPDKQFTIDNYYERQGMEQRKAIQEEVAKDLPDIIESARTKPEEFEGSVEEDRLMELVQQLPEIMLSEDFQSLPVSTKTRIATAIANSGQQQQGA